jgi:hypothetical protein
MRQSRKLAANGKRALKQVDCAPVSGGFIFGCSML